VLPKTLIKGFDKGRLKWLLAVFFLAMAVPTGALIWQAYSQLKWEAFHQYRGLAEDLTGRVDAQLTEMIATADARSFADYTFLNLTGETAYKFVERSPLSAYPVTEDLPGVMGYFQVDSNGSFSTPLLPPEGADAEKLGLRRKYRQFLPKTGSCKRERMWVCDAICSCRRRKPKQMSSKTRRNKMSLMAPNRDQDK
jgi:hypothetical protein